MTVFFIFSSYRNKLGNKNLDQFLGVLNAVRYVLDYSSFLLSSHRFLPSEKEKVFSRLETDLWPETLCSVQNIKW